MDVPVKIYFVQRFKVHDGYPGTLSIKIHCDSVTATAPIHRNSNVNAFSQLEADLSQIPMDEVKKLIRKEPDENEYYIFHGHVEATFGSASMKYVLVLEGES